MQKSCIDTCKNPALTPALSQINKMIAGGMALYNKAIKNVVFRILGKNVSKFQSVIFIFTLNSFSRLKTYISK